MGYPGFIGFFVGIVEPVFPYVFDPLLTPLLNIGGPLTGARLTVLVVSVILAALFSLLYYLLMDLEAYEELQERRKHLNEKMQEAKDEGEMDAVNDHMQKMGSITMENFKLMLKPMIASMLLFFLLLPWMYVTFNPIMTAELGGTGYEGELVYNGHQQPFTVVNASEGHVVEIDGDQYGVGDAYTMQDLRFKVKTIDIAEESAEVKFAAEIVQLPFSLPIVGDELSWLGTYIIVLIPLNLIFRKMLGIQ